MEAFSQLQIAQDLGYLTAKDIDDIRPSFIEVAKKMNVHHIQLTSNPARVAAELSAKSV